MNKLFCSVCGNKLTYKNREVDNTLYCRKCDLSFYDNPVCSVLVVVLNSKNEVILLKQKYVSENHWVLVAGYLDKEETLEECAKREVFEETGLTLKSCEYISSYYHSKKGLIMAGFFGYVDDTKYTLDSDEVDNIMWSKLDDALLLMRDGSIGKKHLNNIIKKING